MAYHASTCFDAGLFFLFELVTMIQTKTTAELSYSILYGVFGILPSICEVSALSVQTVC